MVSSLLSAYNHEGARGQKKSPAPSFTYTKVFDEQFPYYLSIGMSADDYWNGDNELVEAYRKAEKLRFEQKNYELWLQGAYIYDALCSVSPVLQAFAKKGTKPVPYTEKPYALTEKKQKQEQQEKDKLVAEKGIARLKAIMKAQQEAQKKDKN